MLMWFEMLSFHTIYSNGRQIKFPSRRITLSFGSFSPYACVYVCVCAFVCIILRLFLIISQTRHFMRVKSVAVSYQTITSNIKQINFEWLYSVGILTLRRVADCHCCVFPLCIMFVGLLRCGAVLCQLYSLS